MNACSQSLFPKFAPPSADLVVHLPGETVAREAARFTRHLSRSFRFDNALLTGIFASHLKSTDLSAVESLFSSMVLKSSDLISRWKGGSWVHFAEHLKGTLSHPLNGYLASAVLAHSADDKLREIEDHACLLMRFQDPGDPADTGFVLCEPRELLPHPVVLRLGKTTRVEGMPFEWLLALSSDGRTIEGEFRKQSQHGSFRASTDEFQNAVATCTRLAVLQPVAAATVCSEQGERQATLVLDFRAQLARVVVVSQRLDASLPFNDVGEIERILSTRVCTVFAGTNSERWRALILAAIGASDSLQSLRQAYSNWTPAVPLWDGSSSP